MEREKERTMIYRPAESKDIRDINVILTDSFDRHYAYYAIKSFETLENVLVVEDESALLGIVNWRVLHVEDKRLGYIFWLAVSPEHRGQGVGLHLVMEAIEWIWEDNAIDDIYVTIDKNNVASQKLFGQLDFLFIRRDEMKKKYHNHCAKLFREMMYMPWENLYCLTRKSSVSAFIERKDTTNNEKEL